MASGDALKKYTDEDILKAFAVYKTGGLMKAFKLTGIPRGTLRRRFLKMEENESGASLVEKQVREKVMEAAIERASFYLSDRVIALSNKLFDTAEEALEKTKDTIEMNQPRRANYLKALTTVWQTAIQSGQLLSNKPTSREEVNINQANPEDLTDDQLAGIIRAGKVSLSQN